MISTVVNHNTQLLTTTITHGKNTVVKYFIPESTKIKLWIKGCSTAYKGTLKIINESKIEVNGNSSNRIHKSKRIYNRGCFNVTR